MNLERFAILIEAYGTDPARWPAAERNAALALLSASADARRLCDEARSLDALLTTPPPALEPSAALKARVLAQVVQTAPQHGGWRMQVVEALALLFPGGRAMPQLAALALAFAIGIGAGLANIGAEPDSDLILLQLATATPVYIEE